jgi:hypothetical protein
MVSIQIKDGKSDDMLNDWKQIENYIENYFLPKSFRGFEKKMFVSKNTYHTTSFEFNDIEYNLDFYFILDFETFKNLYSVQLSIAGKSEMEILFPETEDLEELFLVITKSMKEYRLTKLYK